MSSTEPKSWPAKVRTTIAPKETVEVTREEWVDLKRQGLLFEGKAADAEAAVKKASAETPVHALYSPEASADGATPATGTDQKGD